MTILEKCICELITEVNTPIIRPFPSDFHLHTRFWSPVMVYSSTIARSLGRQIARPAHLWLKCGHRTMSTAKWPTNHEKIQQVTATQNYIDNIKKESSTTQWIDLHDPATNNLVTRVPESTNEELNEAVRSAERAFPAWRNTSWLHRQQIMFKFVALIRENWDRLAASITLEQGKTFADARGDVLRGLQVAETACGITTQAAGQVLEVSKGMETREYREPLGVVAAICPFSEH
jgi:malonate-semialdehyde dehydrogenase (acetylating)/methylmalonate-semialdehyde dehydrogenase